MYNRKLLIIIIGIVSLLSIIIDTAVYADLSVIIADKQEFKVEESNGISIKNNYTAYLERYKDSKRPQYEVVIDANSFVSSDGGVKILNEFLGKRNVIQWGNHEMWAEWEVQVPEAGLYNIAIGYCVTENTNRDPQCRIEINGEVPFQEANNIVLTRIFEDATEIRRDLNDNEISPKQKLALIWYEQGLKDRTGLYTDDYLFYLMQGKNTIKIYSKGPEFVQSYIKIYQKEEPPTYTQLMQNQENKGYSDTSGHMIKIQAENAKYKSSSVLYPGYDRISPATNDSKGNLNNPSKIRINVIGGNLWNIPGQWITWIVYVPESGYYNLAIKFRQNYIDGFFTSRDLYIDGQIPFKEVKGLQFPYDSDWQILVPKDENGEPYKFYLTKGPHEIKLEVTLGVLTETLRTLKQSLYELNDLYRRIVMITGVNPDRYTDYFLEQRIPNLKDTLERNRATIEKQMENLIKIAGAKGGKTAILERLNIQLRSFIEEGEEEIVKRLANFKNNLSALGAWIVELEKQPLLLDYIVLMSPDQKVPSPGTSFLNSLFYSIRRFLASFNKENEYIGGVNQTRERVIRVWINSGRDQAQILRGLIDESFTPETGIGVDLELVQGSLIAATLAGQGPDVALTVPEDQPVNFAMRGALYDLSRFEDFGEIASRFHESALVPFEYLGGYYALPETQVFNMFFYRTDVFEELGIKPPKTWTDLYNIIPIIQRNNLQITLQNDSNNIFATLLYQLGGQFYSEDGSKAMFDTPVAIEAFKIYTDFYTSYSFPLVSDFYSRFRSGELVASIQPYNMYNLLTVGAPEIAGLWEMVPIPGTMDENGNIDISQTSTVTGTIMFKRTKDKEAAWEFMKWWSSAEVQSKYGIELEGIMGPSARYTPANREAFVQLPWSEEQIQQLLCAWDSLKGIPQVPGSYYTARALTNAFRNVTYNRVSPREALILQNKYLNDEITRKRKEFGLPVAEER